MVRRMMFAASTLLALTVAGPAEAAPRKRVLVAGFEARNPSMAATALRMPDELEQTMMAGRDVDIVTIDALPPVSDMAASLYASTCPPAQAIGCAFVLGLSLIHI